MAAYLSSQLHKGLLMKVQIEIIGHAPKQKAALLKMLKDFTDELPSRISVGAVKLTEVKVKGARNG